MEYKNDSHVTDLESLRRDNNRMDSLLNNQETTPEAPIDSIDPIDPTDTHNTGNLVNSSSIDKTPVQTPHKFSSSWYGDFVVMEDIESLKQQIINKDNEIKDLREELTEALDEKDKYIDENNVLKTDLSNLRRYLANAEKDIYRFKQTIREQNNSIEKLEKESANDSKVFQRQIGDLNEKLANYEAAKSKERKDMEDLRRYRSLYEKFAKMIRNQFSGIKSYLKTKDLEGIEAIVDSIFEQFEEIRPAVNTPYNSDEHTLYEQISGDSANLFIAEVKKPGYKLEGIIIEKAAVSVNRIKQKEINSETGN